MKILQGITVSRGLGIGKAYIIEKRERPQISTYPIMDSEKEGGWKRFTAALNKVRTDIKLLLETPDPEQHAIFETYLLMLSDTDFISQLETAYLQGSHSIEFVVEEKTEEFAGKLRGAGDAYLAARADDISDIYGRVVNELLGIKPFNYANIPLNAVVVARSLNPSEAGELVKRSCAALVIEEGGINSHLAILARNYGIPSIFTVPYAVEQIQNGMQIIVDTELGKVITEPDAETLEQYAGKQEQERKRQEKLARHRFRPAALRDGTPILLMANIGTVEEAQAAFNEGADGIGLFRTEFLFMKEASETKSRGIGILETVSEELQFNAYREVLEIMQRKPVTIRTLDAGGDKIIETLDMPCLDEANPLLGLRAIRLTLANPPLFKTQLRALYRASVYGELRIMLPLITHVAQVKESLRLIKEVQTELTKEQIPFRANTPVGIMVETAGAALISDILTHHSDFFSVGTNDLTQYTLGIDRENAVVADLFSEFHMGILRLISYTVKCADRAGIPVSVCGEMAGREDGMKVLAGLGVRTLSMSANLICEAKEILGQYTSDELSRITEKAVASPLVS